jgi:hypothetical protein
VRAVDPSLRFAAASALALALAACAQAPLPPHPEVQEITMLWGQIRQWRHEAKMEVEPARASIIAMAPKPVRYAEQSCPDGHQVPAACTEICDPAEAICDNAERICELANQLADSDWASWAKEKCDSAKASCNEAKKRCCACEHEEQAP